ncbi:MAG: hypothetical protein M1837_001957 [Sclerophora amabilis]|nr:MAG: hypothetical protein M1837_001957 [Sclerophora amabilis]
MSSSPLTPARNSSPPSSRFLDLPAELRTKIYQMVLVVDGTIDLDPENVRRIAPRLDLFQTSRQIHKEAYHVFYGGNTFRVFPLHGRFFHTKYPLLSRMTPRYRAAIKSLELRLGPGWTSPPKSWAIGPILGLKDATSLLVLKVFVECDPSHDVFKGFRVGKDFYTCFSGDLLRNLIAALPSVVEVQFEAYPSVSRSGPLMSRLIAEAEAANTFIIWNSSGESDSTELQHHGGDDLDLR